MRRGKQKYWYGGYRAVGKYFVSITRKKKKKILAGVGDLPGDSRPNSLELLELFFRIFLFSLSLLILFLSIIQ